MLQVDSKDAVGSDQTFEVLLAEYFNGAGFVSWITGDSQVGFSISYQIGINCSNFCGELSSIGTNQQPTVGVFKHGPGGTYSLMDMY